MCRQNSDDREEKGANEAKTKRGYEINEYLQTAQNDTLEGRVACAWVRVAICLLYPKISLRESAEKEMRKLNVSETK